MKLGASGEMRLQGKVQIDLLIAAPVLSRSLPVAAAAAAELQNRAVM
jgi:hypothetical protein